MKIYSNQADQYIHNLKNPKNIIALIYGPDSGAVRHYRNKLIAKIDPTQINSNIVDISADDIKNNSSILLDEIKSPDFFSSFKIIVIDGHNSTLAEAFNKALEIITDDISLILTTDELGKDSKLRSFFESHKTYPTILCYKEDARNIRSLINQQFTANNIKLGVGVLDFLTANLGEDKQITLNEIEKILLYLGDQKNLDFEAVSNLLADSSELSLNDIANSISQKNPAGLEKCLSRAALEHTSEIAIIRSCYAHFQKIMLVKNSIKLGLNVEEALRTLRPPIFFKQVDNFKSSLNKWNIDQLENVLSSLLKLELSAKTAVISPELTCHNELIKLAC